jgi:hypothetical protein
MKRGADDARLDAALNPALLEEEGSDEPNTLLHEEGGGEEIRGRGRRDDWNQPAAERTPDSPPDSESDSDESDNEDDSGGLTDSSDDNDDPGGRIVRPPAPHPCR